MMSRRLFLARSAASLGAASLAAPLPVFAAERPVAPVTGGTVRGVIENGSLAFRGLPYAADTAGVNRFKAPRPVTPWEGVRDAASYGPMMPQFRSDLGLDDPVFEWYHQPQETGEDGLVLNVYTPDLDAGAGRPVLFYVHGGGYINGSGGGTGLDGGPLARFGDVVVVTINHRLNAFGYTALSHIDPENFGDAVNAGHLDIIAALHWVRDNIATFGGDAGNVTLFGQSGGGSKILSLIAMPGAQGLFHKAISMSGAAGLKLDPQEELEPYADAFLAELGVSADNLEVAQHLTTRFVLDARMRAVARTFEGARPAIDGRHILHQSMSPEGMAMHADIPLMFGHTKTESTLFLRRDMRNFNISGTQMRARLKAGFAIDDAAVDAIIAGYRATDPEMSPSDILIAVTSDVQFRLPLSRAAASRAAAGGQAPVWMYNFTWEIPYDGGILGAPHAVDIPFAFGTLDAAGAMIGTGDAAHEAALNMMSAFVAFARTGNPNNDRLPDWAPYDGRTRVSMLMQSEPEAAEDWRGPGREAVADLVMDPFNRAALWRYQAE